MGAAIPPLPKFAPYQEARRPHTLHCDCLATARRLPGHWAALVDAPGRDHPGCRAGELVPGEGLRLPSPSLLQCQRTYAPYRQRAVMRGRIQVHGVQYPEALTPKTRDAVVWFCSTRSLGYGNGVVCSLVVRHYFRDFGFSRYEMHIAASVAPYRVPHQSHAPPPEWAPERALPEVPFPFFYTQEMYAEPSPVDVFDFQVVDDGQKVVFSLDRYTERGNSHHSMSLVTPFQAGPTQDGCRVGVGTGDAKCSKVVVSDVCIALYPLQRQYLKTDIVRGCSSEVKTAVLMASHPRLGAGSPLRRLPAAVLYRVLGFLDWGRAEFYHDRRPGPGEALARERLAADPSLRAEHAAARVGNLQESFCADLDGDLRGSSDSTECHSARQPTRAPPLMAGPGAKWAELWWQPKSFVNLLMTRRDFRFGGGALLAVLRFVYGRVQKRIAVVSRVTWTSGKRSPDDFTFIGMTFGISGGSGPPQPQAELDPREVFEMSVSVGGRVLSSQMFGALSLGDVLEYHIYDDGFNYAFKLLHLPQSALDEDRSDLATVDPSSPSPLDLQSPADVLCAEADAESLEATDSSGGAAALDNGPPAGHRRRSDASDSSAAASLRSLAPLPGANAYVLRGAFRWAPEEFPVVLTLTEDDPVHCSLPDLEYDLFAVHHLASKGCPF